MVIVQAYPKSLVLTETYFGKIIRLPNILYLVQCIYTLTRNPGPMVEVCTKCQIRSILLAIYYTDGIKEGGLVGVIIDGHNMIISESNSFSYFFSE